MECGLCKACSIFIANSMKGWRVCQKHVSQVSGFSACATDSRIIFESLTPLFASAHAFLGLCALGLGPSPPLQPLSLWSSSQTGLCTILRPLLPLSPHLALSPLLGASYPLQLHLFEAPLAPPLGGSFP